MDIGPGDAGGVGRQDDGTVHLGQFGNPLGAELGVQQEASRTDGKHTGTVPDHHQCAPLGPEDAIQPVTQRPAGCDHGQSLTDR